MRAMGGLEAMLLIERPRGAAEKQVHNKLQRQRVEVDLGEKIRPNRMLLLNARTKKVEGRQGCYLIPGQSKARRLKQKKEGPQRAHRQASAAWKRKSGAGNWKDEDGEEKRGINRIREGDCWAWGEYRKGIRRIGGAIRKHRGGMARRKKDGRSTNEWWGNDDSNKLPYPYVDLSHRRNEDDLWPNYHIRCAEGLIGARRCHHHGKYWNDSTPLQTRQPNGLAQALLAWLSAILLRERKIW